MIFALLLLAGLSAQAAEKPAKAASPKAESAIPYLGPGADKMSAEEYEKVYRNYIQTSVLLGYPVERGRMAACDQALDAIFRQMGMFSYPVPGDAQQIARSTKVIKNFKVETYELGGGLIQVLRDGKIGGLQRVIVVNSSSTRATRRLGQTAKKEIIDLERDPRTGLERVKGLPVGFPHPFLSKAGQGLFVKVLRFNGKVDGCEPVEFTDNNWLGGFELSESRCTEIQADAENVWKERLTTDEFYARELKRMKERAVKAAVKNGAKDEEARALVEKHLTPPFTAEINVVGDAMANLAQCNLVAMGRASGPKPVSPDGQGTGDKNTTTKGAGSAE